MQHLLMGKPRLREVKWSTQGYAANKWQNWGDFSHPEPDSWTYSAYCQREWQTDGGGGVGEGEGQ